MGQAREAFLREGARNRVEVDLAPDLPRVMADEQRVLQVLNNLLVNASKYSPESSTIRMKASPEDVYVAFSVQDEGRGVPSDLLTISWMRRNSNGKLRYSWAVDLDTNG